MAHRALPHDRLAILQLYRYSDGLIGIDDRDDLCARRNGRDGLEEEYGRWERAKHVARPGEEAVAEGKVAE
jgi:hypothetical protein